jgi:hypothetical protein
MYLITLQWRSLRKSWLLELLQSCTVDWYSVYFRITLSEAKLRRSDDRCRTEYLFGIILIAHSSPVDYSQIRQKSSPVLSINLSQNPK